MIRSLVALFLLPFLAGCATPSPLSHDGASGASQIDPALLQQPPAVIAYPLPEDQEYVRPPVGEGIDYSTIGAWQ